MLSYMYTRDTVLVSLWRISLKRLNWSYPNDIIYVLTRRSSLPKIHETNNIIAIELHLDSHRRYPLSCKFLPVVRHR